MRSTVTVMSNQFAFSQFSQKHNSCPVGLPPLPSCPRNDTRCVTRRGPRLRGHPRPSPSLPSSAPTLLPPPQAGGGRVGDAEEEGVSKDVDGWDGMTPSKWLNSTATRRR